MSGETPRCTFSLICAQLIIVRPRDYCCMSAREVKKHISGVATMISNVLYVCGSGHMHDIVLDVMYVTTRNVRPLNDGFIHEHTIGKHDVYTSTKKA